MVTVECAVPIEQQVNISVFSVTGQRVAEIYNGSANGTLKITSNLKSLNDGVYFVRVKGSKGLSLYKKLILVKLNP